MILDILDIKKFSHFHTLFVAQIKKKFHKKMYITIKSNADIGMTIHLFLYFVSLFFLSILAVVINKVYFPIMVPVGIIGNILSFLVYIFFVQISVIGNIIQIGRARISLLFWIFIILERNLTFCMSKNNIVSAICCSYDGKVAGR